jgi:hypothetical protein
MSMICELAAVDEDQINQFLADPKSIHDFLEKFEEEDEVGGVDLDKAWHGIHFMLTGTSWEGEEPFCYLIRGGEEINDDEFGYGPARVLRPNQVATWWESLSAISVDELRNRYNPDAMMKANIYPVIWDLASEEEDNFRYLLEHFEILRSFVRQTKQANKGAIILLT